MTRDCYLFKCIWFDQTSWVGTACSISMYYYLLRPTVLVENIFFSPDMKQHEFKNVENILYLKNKNGGSRY